MAIADTITSMQAHTSNAYTMIGYGTDLTGINKNLENLSSTIFNAFLEALRTPDTLFTNLPKKSGTGANITLNDTANAPMRIELGASELTQASTPTPSSPQEVHTISGDNTLVVCGKNLFDYKNAGVLENFNFPNDYIQADNTCNLAYIPCLPNTTYTISRRTPMASRFWVGTTATLPILNTPVMNSQKVGDNTTTSLTITTSSTAKYLVMRFIYNLSDDYETYAKTIQVELGSPATTYEPYISQEADIDLGYENLLKVNNTLVANRTAAGLTTLVNFDKSISVVGTSSAVARYWTSNDDNKQLFKAGTYTFFIECSDASIECVIQTKKKDSGTTNTWLTTNKKISFTINEDFYVYNGYWKIVNGGVYNFISTINLVAGSEVKNVVNEPIDYCKIGNYTDEFIRTSGKNLFDKDSADIVTGYIDGTTGNVVLGGTSKVTREYISILPNTDMNISGFNNIVLAFYNKDKTFIERVLTASSSYTFNKNAYYIKIQGTGDTFNADAIMLNLGTTALPYEPYGSNEWYIKKNIGKVVLDGTQGKISTPSTNRFNIDNALQDYVRSVGNKTYICNGYSAYNQTATNGDFNNLVSSVNYGFNFTSGNSNTIRFKNTDCSTTTDFTNSLTSNPITLYYVLATPTYTQITGTLETQLENVYQKLLSYVGTTNISQINNDLSFNMSVQAIEV